MTTGLGRRQCFAIAYLFVALAVATSGMAANSVEGEVESHDVTFQTTMPCAYACPHVALLALRQSDRAGEAACAREPITTPGSFDEIRVTVPARVDSEPTSHLRFGISPTYWSDGVVCQVLHAGSEEEIYAFRRFAYHTVGCPQTTPLDGCYVETVETVNPGETVVLRVFNGIDETTLRGSYAWCSFYCLG